MRPPSWDLGLGIWDLGFSLMRQRVEHGVDAKRVAVGTEVHEVRRIVALALPRVAEVGVVRHQDDDAALAVGDRARVRHGAVRTAFRRAARSEEEVNRGNLSDFLHLELRVEDRMFGRQIEYRELGCGKRLSQLAYPPAPGVFAPEIVGPE